MWVPSFVSRSKQIEQEETEGTEANPLSAFHVSRISQFPEFPIFQFSNFPPTAFRPPPVGQMGTRTLTHWIDRRSALVDRSGMGTMGPGDDWT